MLVYGFDGYRAPDPIDFLSSFVPTLRRITDLSEVRQAEYDALLTDDSVPQALEPHLFVLAIGRVGLSHPVVRTGMQSEAGELGARFTVITSEFAVPDDLPATVERLVTTDLLPTLAAQAELGGSIQVLTENWDRGPVTMRTRASGDLTPDAVEPFLLTPDGLAVAGRFRRLGGQAEAWAIPSGCNVSEWMRVAIEQWNEMAPERFPRSAKWSLGDQWMTPTERAAAQEVASAQRERLERLGELDARITEVAGVLAAATASADSGERRLLTAQGDELVDVVVQALSELGLSVHIADETAKEGDKLEDLQVRLPSEPDWVAIAEVRGYAKGAKLADLTRLQGRFKGRFIKETGREPTRMWHIVNHFLKEDPVARELTLRSNADEVEIFAEDGGLIIESPELYKLWMGMRAGELSTEAACKLLVTATGRFRVADG